MKVNLFSLCCCILLLNAFNSSIAIRFSPQFVSGGDTIFITLDFPEENARVGGDIYLSIGGQVGSERCTQDAETKVYPYFWKCIVPKDAHLGQQFVAMHSSGSDVSSLIGRPSRESVFVGTRGNLVMSLGSPASDKQLEMKFGGYSLFEYYLAIGNKSPYVTNYGRLLEQNKIISSAILKSNSELTKRLLTSSAKVQAAQVYPVQFPVFASQASAEALSEGSTDLLLPAPCNQDIIMRRLNGNATQILYDFADANIDPTAEPWTGEDLFVDNYFNESLNLNTEERTQINKMVSDYLSLPPTNVSQTTDDPIVFIIDSAIKTDGKVIDPYRVTNHKGVEFVGHGSVIAEIIQNISGIPKTSFEFIPACASYNGRCEMPLVIQGICKAASMARTQSKPVLVNMSLGTSLPGKYLKEVILYALNKGVTILTSYGNLDQYGICVPYDSSANSYVSRDGDQCHQYPAEWTDLIENSSPDYKGRLFSAAGMVPYNGQWIKSNNNRVEILNPERIAELRVSQFVPPTLYAPMAVSYNGQSRVGTSYSSAMLTGVMAAWFKNSKTKNLPSCLGRSDFTKEGFALNFKEIITNNCAN